MLIAIAYQRGGRSPVRQSRTWPRLRCWERNRTDKHQCVRDASELWGRTASKRCSPCISGMLPVGARTICGNQSRIAIITPAAQRHPSVDLLVPSPLLKHNSISSTLAKVGGFTRRGLLAVACYCGKKQGRRALACSRRLQLMLGKTGPQVLHSLYLEFYLSSTSIVMLVVCTYPNSG